MLGGIVFQLGMLLFAIILNHLLLNVLHVVAIVVYTACAFEFFLRYVSKKPVRRPQALSSPELGSESTATISVEAREKQKDGTEWIGKSLGKVKMMGFGLMFSTLVILIRYAILCHAYGQRTKVPAALYTVRLNSQMAGKGVLFRRRYTLVSSVSLLRMGAAADCFQDVLDGAMIVLAIYTLNFLHPGRLLR
jgi:hypothetical protein